MDLTDEKLVRELIEAASAQRQYSYAPYSGYRVGAALLAADGQVYTGCNVENAAWSPTLCAERTAVGKAVSEGARQFEAICVVGGRGEVPTSYSAPCGVCRQVLREFCDPAAFRVILATDPTHYAIYTLQELLPQSFGPDTLAES